MFLRVLRILALLITLVIQLIIQRDLEKMIGWWRMTLIYIGSGLAGSLGSVIFMPYYVEVRICELRLVEVMSKV